MAGLARVDAEENERGIVPTDATVRADMAEEVRRRWVSIAAHYVAQRRNFETSVDPDEGSEAWHDFSPSGQV